MSFDMQEAHEDAVREDMMDQARAEDLDNRREWKDENGVLRCEYTHAAESELVQSFATKTGGFASLPPKADVVQADCDAGRVVYRDAGLSASTEAVRKCQHAGRAAAAGVPLVIA